MTPITQFAREYPLMAAVLVVVIAAGVFVMLDEMMASYYRRHRTDEQKLADRKCEAIRKANQWYENESNEPRLHWWN